MTRPMPVGWSPNSNASATPSSSTPSPDPTAEQLEDGLRPPRADARLQHPYSRVCVLSDLVSLQQGSRGRRSRCAVGRKGRGGWLGTLIASVAVCLKAAQGYPFN